MFLKILFRNFRDCFVVQLSKFVTARLKQLVYSIKPKEVCQQLFHLFSILFLIRWNLCCFALFSLTAWLWYHLFQHLSTPLFNFFNYFDYLLNLLFSMCRIYYLYSCLTIYKVVFIFFLLFSYFYFNKSGDAKSIPQQH